MAVVCRFKKLIPKEEALPVTVRYDFDLQLWTNTITNKPYILDLLGNGSLEESRWGETTLTKADGEGVDYQESINASKWGETVITETREGIDQHEVLQVSKWGETIHTAATGETTE